VGYLKALPKKLDIGIPILLLHGWSWKLDVTYWFDHMGTCGRLAVQSLRHFENLLLKRTRIVACSELYLILDRVEGDESKKIKWWIWFWARPYNKLQSSVTKERRIAGKTDFEYHCMLEKKVKDASPQACAMASLCSECGVCHTTLVVSRLPRFKKVCYFNLGPVGRAGAKFRYPRPWGLTQLTLTDGHEVSDLQFAIFCLS
jgi:hypothetical protein